MNDATHGTIYIECVNGSTLSFTGTYKDYKEIVVTANENSIVGNFKESTGVAVALSVNNIIGIRFTSDES